MVGDEGYKVLFFYYAPVKINKRASNASRDVNRASESGRAYFNKAKMTTTAIVGVASSTQNL